VFEAGLQVFDGQRARDYVRILQPNGLPAPDEWGRFARQNQVIAALQAAILKPENWPAIPELIVQFYDLLVTDLSPQQLLDLNCMVQAVGGNFVVLEVQPDMVALDSGGRMIPDAAEISNLIAVSVSE
jgi:anionic cell wall polymer biosynthesis LytR-Cps2A-Psr (LCP) family protein